MTNLSSVSLFTPMRKYHHLPSLLFPRTHTVKPLISLILNFINPKVTLFYPLLTPLSLSFCLLDKLFGKRLLQARHYIMSRKSWLKMVPTENCDILMTFPGMSGSDPSSLFVLWWIPSFISAFGGRPASEDLVYSHGTIKFHPFMVPAATDHVFPQCFYGSCSRGMEEFCSLAHT